MRKLIGTLVMRASPPRVRSSRRPPAQAIPPNQFCELFVLSVTADDVLNDGGSDRGVREAGPVPAGEHGRHVRRPDQAGVGLR
jgi:hypothetical protein